MIVCPRCLSDHSDHSVLTKLDNKTEICKVCSLEESMIEWYNIKQRSSEIPGDVMLRETEFTNKLFQKPAKSI